MSDNRRTQTFASPGQPSTTAEPMELGTIKWFDERRRYGFITPDTGEQDIFFPWTVLKSCGIAERDAQEGIRVRFKWQPPERAGRRPSATFIALIRVR
jgi:CspA family cold shock protein